MSEHTPGPWTVVRLMGRTSFLLYYPDATSEGQAQANRTLIEAAPDLLEALKAVVAVADRKTDEFDKAHAAIAKAKGTR